MKIAVLGSGNVGGVLARRWAEMGHQVTFGSREPESNRLQEMLRAVGPNLCAGTVAEAVKASDVVILATPWNAAEETIRTAGSLAGKVLVDATNPIAENGGLATGFTTSAGEQVALWAQDAQVVKALNATGAGNMADPGYAGGQPTMFICGGDMPAKAAVSELVSVLGFEVIDVGPLFVARYLEPLAMLWITLAYRQGLGPDIAFKLLRRARA